MADTGDDDAKDRLADTNMENYGGEEHRAKQQAIAQKQEEWRGAGADVGLEVWRIEKFKVVRQAQETYGDFFNGDSYIVLNTYKPDPSKELLAYNVHFWLGENTSQDEAGAAAIKTVELDDCLGDLPVQYREVQGHETKHFTNLFPSMSILEGGVDTGFRHVEPETYQPRLFHVAGKPKKMRVDQVPLDMDSLNNCDAFVLDHGDVIYQFRPPHASAWEKQASNKFVNDLSSSRHGKVKDKHIVNMGDSGEHVDAFWGYFGGAEPAELPETPARVAKKQEEEEVQAAHVNKMFHVTDENGAMEINEVQSGVLDRAILAQEDDDVLIIDVGRVVFVWIGSSANREELRSAMTHATQYLADNGRPMWTPVERVLSGREPSHFWKAFGSEHVAQDII